MNDIQLNLINESNDANNSEIVIFSKNVATSFDEIAVAWKVIQNLGRGDHHPFTYSAGFQIAASDSYGNYTPKLTATEGQEFEMVRDTSGDVIKYKGPATSNKEIELINNLSKGAINAGIYKSGNLFAQKTGISPGQKAVFSFKPTIFIGVASQVQEGEVLNSAIISDVNTEISLLGIASADIVMTGGGPGANATPFVFTLKNVVYA